MEAPTSRFGCFSHDCVACHGDEEWQQMMVLLHAAREYMEITDHIDDDWGDLIPIEEAIEFWEKRRDQGR
jgi:hypothetical protein